MLTNLGLRILQGALSGALSAAYIDLQAFRTWKSTSELHEYNWKLAGSRWLSGAITGALGAISLGAVADVPPV